MELKKFDKKARNYWLIKNLITVAVLGICFAAFAAVLYIGSDGDILPCLLLFIPYLVLSAVLIIFPFLKYAHYAYGFDENKIEIKKGVIFRHHASIPVCQIQDMHIIEGPIMTVFGVCCFTISTAGSNFTVIGIEAKEAENIVDHIEVCLKKQIESDLTDGETVTADSDDENNYPNLKNAKVITESYDRESVIAEIGATNTSGDD